MDTERKKCAPCTPAIYQEALQALRNGTTLTQYAETIKEKPGYPTVETIRNYINLDNARFQEYTRAREIGSHAMAESTIDIADNMRDAQHANNRIRARQWLASKMQPRVYGDKLDIDVKGSIDIQAAILAARRRSQVIDVTPEPAKLTTDIQSDVVEPVDPFS